MMYSCVKRLGSGSKVTFSAPNTNKMYLIHNTALHWTVEYVGTKVAGRCWPELWPSCQWAAGPWLRWAAWPGAGWGTPRAPALRPAALHVGQFRSTHQVPNEFCLFRTKTWQFVTFSYEKVTILFFKQKKLKFEICGFNLPGTEAEYSPQDY